MESQQEFTSMPRIGDKAPEFEAVTTQGNINFPADYKGDWVILFSHPADFTPVCTSEFMTFATMEDKFANANCKLVVYQLTVYIVILLGYVLLKRKLSIKE